MILRDDTVRPGGTHGCFPHKPFVLKKQLIPVVDNTLQERKHLDVSGFSVCMLFIKRCNVYFLSKIFFFFLKCKDFLHGG